MGIRTEKSTSPETWIKSSRCGTKGNCVELSAHPAGVIIRDSKAGTGAVLPFGVGAWRSFMTGHRPAL
jgi:hypothetical protein